MSPSASTTGPSKTGSRNSKTGGQTRRTTATAPKTPVLTEGDLLEEEFEDSEGDQEQETLPKNGSRTRKAPAKNGDGSTGTPPAKTAKPTGPPPPADLFVKGWGQRRVPDSLMSYTPGESVFSATGKQLLTWSPVVTRNLVTYSPRGKCLSQMVTLEIGDVTATVPYAEVTDGTVWRDNFPNVAGGQSRQIRDVLAAIVKELATELPLTSTTPAWTAEGRLQLPPADILPSGYLDTAGDRADYGKLLELVAEEPTVALVMGLAIGGLYVRPLMESRPGLQAYIVHMCGRSRRGKSTGMRSTATIFGKPTISGVIRKWNVSASGLNAWLRELAMLTGFRDEISNARFRDTDYEAMVLSATEGAGRDTATKTNRSRESEGDWYGALISTGNKSILGRIANEAAAARVIELTTPITTSAARAKAIDALAKDCYGHGLAALVESDWTPAKFEKSLNAAAEVLGLPEEGGVEETLCWNMAFGVAGAAVLADLFDVKAFADAAATAAAVRFAELRDGLADRGESPGARLRAAIVGAVASGPAQFPTRSKYAENLTYGVKDVSGWDLSGDDHNGDLAVISTRLKAIAEAGGVDDLKSAMDDLRAEGALIPRRDGKATNQLKVAGKNWPVYLFRNLFQEDDAESENAEDTEKTEDEGSENPGATDGTPGYQQETLPDLGDSPGSPGSPAGQDPVAHEKTGPDLHGSPSGSPETLSAGYPNTPSDLHGSPGSPGSPVQSTRIEEEKAVWIAETEAAIHAGDSAYFGSEDWQERCRDLRDARDLNLLPVAELDRLGQLYTDRVHHLAAAVIPAQRPADLTESVRSPKDAKREAPRSPKNSAPVVDTALSAVGIDVVRGHLVASPAPLPDGVTTLPQVLEWAAGLRLGRLKPMPRNTRVRHDGLVYLSGAAAELLGLPAEAPGLRVNNKTDKIGKALRKDGWEWIENRGMTGLTSIYRGKGPAKTSLRLCVLTWRQAEKMSNAPEFAELAGGSGPLAATMADRQNRISTIGYPLIWTSAASGLGGLKDHKPTKQNRLDENGSWLRDDQGAYVHEQRPGSVEMTAAPMPRPLMHHAHPAVRDRRAEDMVVEEDYAWVRGGDYAAPALSDAERAMGWAVTVDNVTSFAAVLETLTVPLGTYTHGGPTRIEPATRDSDRLVGFAKADLSGVQVEDGMPHFAGAGHTPDGPAWYALPTIYYAINEYGFDGEVSETLICNRSGRLFDTWWPAIRTEYLSLMASAGVGDDLKGQAFLDAYDGWKDRADDDTLALLKALKMIYKGTIGKLKEGPAGDIEAWVARIEKDPWHRPDIRAYVLAEARTRSHRRYRLTLKYTGRTPFAVFRDCAVYALPVPSPLPLMSPDKDPDTGKPINGALRLGIRPGCVKPEDHAPLADVLTHCAQVVAENPAAAPNPAGVTAHWHNRADQAQE